MTLALHGEFNIVTGQIMCNDMQVIFGHEQSCLPAQCPWELCSCCRFCRNWCAIYVARQTVRAFKVIDEDVPFLSKIKVLSHQRPYSILSSAENPLYSAGDVQLISVDLI